LVYWNILAAVCSLNALLDFISVYVNALYIAAAPPHCPCGAKSWVQPFLWRCLPLFVFLESRAQIGPNDRPPVSY
jgi:hypothetical protein